MGWEVGWVVDWEHVGAGLGGWLGTNLSVEGCGGEVWWAWVWSIVMVRDGE